MGPVLTVSMLTPKDVTPRMLAGSPVQRRVGRECEVSTPPNICICFHRRKSCFETARVAGGHFVYWPFPCSCIGVPQTNPDFRRSGHAKIREATNNRLMKQLYLDRWTVKCSR